MMIALLVYSLMIWLDGISIAPGNSWSIYTVALNLS